MSETVLALSDVGLTLSGNAGPVEVLRGISLQILQGESVALIGPSGSGKSSLLMLMGGLDRASTGQLAVLGHDLGQLGEDALARFRRDNLGIVFQSFHLIPTMTALENVATPLELAHVGDAEGRARAALASVGLLGRADHYPSQLSGGEQQRVALARALVHRPRLILADEPTGNLDATNGRAVLDLLLALRAEHGATLVLVTHSAEVAAACDRRIRLTDGRIME